MKNIQNNKVLVLIAILLSFALNTSCKTSDVSAHQSIEKITSVKNVSKGTDEISVMTFNVENMFDNIHNEGVGDYAYLPFAMKNTPEVQIFCKAMDKGFYREECFNKNWDNDAVEFKLSQVAKIISYVDNGTGPDNLLLSEVENENILKQLVHKYLAPMGYKTVAILKGPDTRGINTAFISKFPLVGSGCRGKSFKAF
jgi:Endonuclease/Exonuclease/phosphatase family